MLCGILPLRHLVWRGTGGHRSIPHQAGRQGQYCATHLSRMYASCPGLAIDAAHVRVTVPSCHALWGSFVDTPQVLVCQLYRHSSGILLQVLAPFSTGDRHDVLSLVQQPRQRELARLNALLLRYFPDSFDQLQVLLKVLALEAGGIAAVVVLHHGLQAPDLPREESPAQGG